LDIPECRLVAILDADKEGFLRSRTALIQTIGRAARNVDGRVILYADNMTNSLNLALEETERRRNKQIAHNEKHGITPESIQKAISEGLQTEDVEEMDDALLDGEGELLSKPAMEQKLGAVKARMLEHAANLEFEDAAKLRDVLHTLENALLGKIEAVGKKSPSSRFNKRGRKRN
jgi:excinuclease ABC subunit B